MIKSCKGCFYNLGEQCQIMKNKEIGGCFAYADSKEAIKREKEIEEYKKHFDDLIIRQKKS